MQIDNNNPDFHMLISVRFLRKPLITHNFYAFPNHGYLINFWNKTKL